MADGTDSSLRLANMVNAKIEEFCTQNGFTWVKQKTKHMNPIPGMGGKGRSSGVMVTVQFLALLESEPYRSALGYGSKDAISSQSNL